MKNNIVIRVSGDKISPLAMRGKELAILIETFDELMVANTTNTDDNRMIVSATSIESGSIRLGFASALMSTLLASYVSIGSVINSQVYDQTDTKKRAMLRRLVSFVQRHQCEIQLLEYPNNKFIMAKITPDTVVPDTDLFKTEVQVYGYIIRVGGKEPRVMFERDIGGTYYCTVTEDLAIDMGRHLYDEVSVSGIGKWDPYTLDLVELQINKMNKYQRVDPFTALSKFKEKYGVWYQDIENPDKYIAKERKI